MSQQMFRGNLLIERIEMFVHVLGMGWLTETLLHFGAWEKEIFQAESAQAEDVFDSTDRNHDPIGTIV